MSTMRRLSRPSSMTIYVAMWPLPLTSFHVSLASDPQTWQVFCGGYCSLLQAPQCCKTRRLALTASQNGLLNSSATGITLGIVFTPYSEAISISGVYALPQPFQYFGGPLHREIVGLLVERLFAAPHHVAVLYAGEDMHFDVFHARGNSAVGFLNGRR